tara:strand:- start:1517 stop:1810 length:294 start_codon:yes stop_codon:yes gene_type:complete
VFGFLKKKTPEKAGVGVATSSLAGQAVSITNSLPTQKRIDRLQYRRKQFLRQADRWYVKPNDPLSAANVTNAQNNIAKIDLELNYVKAFLALEKEQR